MQQKNPTSHWTCRLCLIFVSFWLCISAEAGGFEPPVQLPVRQFSKLLVSATHPHFLMDSAKIGCKYTSLFSTCQRKKWFWHEYFNAHLFQSLFLLVNAKLSGIFAPRKAVNKRVYEILFQDKQGKDGKWKKKEERHKESALDHRHSFLACRFSRCICLPTYFPALFIRGNRVHPYISRDRL